MSFQDSWGRFWVPLGELLVTGAVITLWVSRGGTLHLSSGLQEVFSAGLWSPRWQQQLTLQLELLRAESYSLGALTGKEIPVAILPLSLCTSQQRCLGFLAGQGFF